MSVREQTLNTRLGDRLAKLGLDAEPEVSTSSGRPDVLISVNGCRVAVEAKIGHYRQRGNEAKTQAKERVEDGVADIGIAVCYPDELAETGEITADSKLWTSVSEGGWQETTVRQMASSVRQIIEDSGDVDALAAKFRKGLEAAAGRLTPGQLREITEVSGGGLKDLRASGVRAALLVASAALFHARLDLHRNDLERPVYDARRADGTEYEGEWPPRKLIDCLTDCLNDSDPVVALVEAWDTILALDYKPVFETGIAMLSSPSQTAELTAFTVQACKTALVVSRNIAGLRHDLLGRVFHRILESAKHTGAFYTSTTAAVLLAGLAIPKGTDVSDYRLVDPACGTGTLLMAAAERIKQITGDRGESISRHLIENVISGYDIELAATHMAAVTLGLMAPDVSFRKMNIHRPYLGVVDGQARCGSLELYAGQMSLMPSPASEQVETGEDTLKAERHDLVIMNPPYTRDSLRHDHLGSVGEQAVKAREREIFKTTAAHRSGGSGMFMLLADRITKKEEGTVAAVLPAASMGAPSAAPVWRHLLDKFHLETVVVSHDPERIWFSENTNINEALFVLRRLNDRNRNNPTRFVRFWVNPADTASALTAVSALENSRAPARATLVEHPRDKILAGDWLPAKFLSDVLVDCTDRWFHNREINVVPLGQIAHVGPAGQGVRGTYDRSDVPDRYGHRALWFNDTTRTRSMRAVPDTYIVAKSGKQTAADRYWSQRGRLLLPTRIRLNTSRVVGVWLDEPLVGSGWVPVRPRPQAARRHPVEWEKAVCVWLNSTPGVLAQIFVSTPKMLSRPQMSIEGQRRIPVPDLTEEQIGWLSVVFDDYKDTMQERLSVVDGPRRDLDETVAWIIGIDVDDVKAARRELAREPAITGRRYESTTKEGTN